MRRDVGGIGHSSEWRAGVVMLVGRSLHVPEVYVFLRCDLFFLAKDSTL